MTFKITWCVSPYMLISRVFSVLPTCRWQSYGLGTCPLFCTIDRDSAKSLDWLFTSYHCWPVFWVMMWCLWRRCSISGKTQWKHTGVWHVFCCCSLRFMNIKLESSFKKKYYIVLVLYSLVCFGCSEPTDEDENNFVSLFLRKIGLASYSGPPQGQMVLAVAQLVSSLWRKEEMENGNIPPSLNLSDPLRELVKKGMCSYLLPGQGSLQQDDLPARSSASAFEKYVSPQILKVCDSQHALLNKRTDWCLCPHKTTTRWANIKCTF